MIGKSRTARVEFAIEVLRASREVSPELALEMVRTAHEHLTKHIQCEADELTREALERDLETQ